MKKTIEREKAVKAIRAHIADLDEQMKKLSAEIFAGGNTAEVVAKKAKKNEQAMHVMAGLKIALEEIVRFS